MGILVESVQLQYNVTFHFERFNPMLGSPDASGKFPVSGGHQTAPFAGDYQFYPLQVKYGVVDSPVLAAGKVGGGFYPFGYTYLQSLFQIL